MLINMLLIVDFYIIILYFCKPKEEFYELYSFNMVEKY